MSVKVEALQAWAENQGQCNITAWCSGARAKFTVKRENGYLRWRNACHDTVGDFLMCVALEGEFEFLLGVSL
jgi:hypothetical protein